LRLYREADKRLRSAEKKLAKQQETAKQTQIDDSNMILQRYEYLLKEEEMTMTQEEIQKNSTETLQQVLEWYNAYVELSPQEQKRQNEIRALETAKDLDQFRTWLKSEERKQFDKDYAERHETTDRNSPKTVNDNISAS
jgi:hypothetical protein